MSVSIKPDVTGQSSASQLALLAATEDPARVPTYEVKHRRTREGLALFGTAVFVVAGVWMMVDGDTDVAQKAVGLLSVAFFGWAGIVIVQRMRRRASVRLTREGLGYTFSATASAHKLIPWRDIEGFAVTNEAGSEFNVVRLASMDALIQQFSIAEATAVLNVFRRMMGFSGAAALVAGANLKFGKAWTAAKLAQGGSAVVSLEDMLSYNRQKFGGEICLAWPDRDRGAEAFHALLTAWKAHADLASARHAR